MSDRVLVGRGEDEEELDPEQRAAVEAIDPRIAILAGPGSGKTRVLSHRARHLLFGHPADRALLLTFTNKAAAEMKARALGVAILPSERIAASTFHTFCMRLLRSHGDLVGLDRDFEILDAEEQGEIADEVAFMIGGRNLPSRWSFHRLRRDDIREHVVLRFGESYEERKRSENVVDFDDLIVLVADLLEQHADIAAVYGHRYRHLLVDEFQDTNPAQFAIVRALCPHVATVSVFADDDQAIYRFVGAEAANARRFIEELGASPYPLTINYRCRETIVARANRLIAADPLASRRQMTAHHPGGEVAVRDFADDVHEAEDISTEIATLIAMGVQAADIAVLARAAFRAQAMLRALERKGVSVSNWLGQLYEPPERRLLATCLAVSRGRLNDRQAVRLAELFDVPLDDERATVPLLERHRQQPGAAALLEVNRLVYAGAAATEIIEQARTSAVLLRPELTTGIEIAAERLASFGVQDPNFTLEHLLAELALGGMGGAPTTGGGVKVASLHRTKGLQWPRVYMLGLEEGRLPDFRAQTEEDIREERRTCFVGVCRAETHLTLSWTRRYGGFINRSSRFLAEMGLDPNGD